MRWNRIRKCPYCTGRAVRRSHRRNFFEAIVLRGLLLRPFRCLDCERRHYNAVFSKLDPREERPTTEDE
jgi:hypothetical protein